MNKNKTTRQNIKKSAQIKKRKKKHSNKVKNKNLWKSRNDDEIILDKKILDIFSLEKIPQSSTLYPIEDNHTCYIIVLNSPTKSWISENVPCCIISKCKKNISMLIKNRTIMFKSMSIEIKSEDSVIRVLSYLYMNADINLFKKDKVIKYVCNQCGFGDCICENKSNDVDMDGDTIDIELRSIPYTDKKKGSDVINLIGKLQKALKDVNPNESIKKLIPEDLINKDILKTVKELLCGRTIINLNFDIMSVVGERSKEVIKKYMKVACNMINIANPSINMLINDELQITNVVYQVGLPKEFTKDLYLMNKRIKTSMFSKKIFHTYDPESFPAIRCKISWICNDHKKTTLEIYSSGAVMITGHKSIDTIKTAYPRLMYFIMTIVKDSHSFIKMFVEGAKVSKTNENELIEKMNEEWVKELEALKNSMKKKMSKGKKLGLLYRKSNIKPPKIKFKERCMEQYDLNIPLMKERNVSTLYNETLKVFQMYTPYENVPTNSTVNILNQWFDVLDYL